MQNTPIASRKQVAIYGNTNVGKSTLFNCIFEQNAAIVSEEKGTTTDPIIKAMELIPFGPIALIDTAGLKDDSILGKKRLKKTGEILNRTDFAIYVMDATEPDEKSYAKMAEQFQKRRIPHLLVLSKYRLAKESVLDRLQKTYPDALLMEAEERGSIAAIKKRLAEELSKLEEKEETILGDIVSAGENVVMVVPVDSEAPKGRLILPQVQLIRDALDHGIKCLVTRDTELKDALDSLTKVDLVVTDSQAFRKVDQIVPKEIPLTSFSILLARQKGDLKAYLEGIEAVSRLKDGSKILMAEACSHNVGHEDIGRVKIPNGLKKFTGKELTFDFVMSYDFPEEERLKEYDLVIHCGACMVNKKSVLSRIVLCEEANVPITNYGLILALFAGILDRATEKVRV